MNGAKRIYLQKFFCITVNLDGPKDINDRQRCGSVGSVHDRVLEKLEPVKNQGIILIYKVHITKIALIIEIHYRKSLFTWGILAFGRSFHSPKR